MKNNQINSVIIFLIIVMGLVSGLAKNARGEETIKWKGQKLDEIIVTAQKK